MTPSIKTNESDKVEQHELTARFSFRMKTWMIGSNYSKRRRQFKNQTDTVYETLEPRKMLNGDGATDLREDVLGSAFNLPPEVGDSLLNILENSGSFSSGAWQAGASNNFGSSQDWSGANTVNAPENNQWRDYLIDDAGQTGLITDTSIDSIALEGGGFLVFQLDTQTERSVIEPDSGGGSGGASSGGMTEDNALGILQKETINTLNTTSFVWVDTQAEVDAITATGSFDPASHGSNFVITVDNNFEFDDRELTNDQIRSFKVTNHYLVSVSYAWSGLSSSTKPSGDGFLTDSVNFDTNGTMLFEGEHVYEGTVSANNEGQFVETFEQSGSGTGNMLFVSNNVVTSAYAEGDLLNEGVGTSVTATVADDFRYLASSSFIYSGDGGRDTSDNDAQSEYHMQTLGNYELNSSPTITTQYESVLDITTQYNQDILDSVNDDGDDGSADGEQEDPQLMEQVLSSASGSSTGTFNLIAHGNTTTSFDTNQFYGGITHTSLDSDSLDYWDTTGSSFISNDEFELKVTAPGYYLKRTGNGAMNITSDSIGETTSLTLLTSDDNSHDDVDADVEGFIDSDTDIVMSNLNVTTSGGFNDRLVISATLGDDETESQPITSDAAIGYANSYISEGMDPDGAVSNPEQPHAEADKSIYYAITQAQYTNNYQQNEAGSEDNFKLTFLTGDASEMDLDGQNQPTWTRSGTSKLSFDTQYSSGDFQGGNGEFFKDHYSINNTGQSNGTFGSNYNMNWLLEEGAITEVPIEGESDDGSGDSTGDYGSNLEIDESKITTTGSTSFNTSSTIDSDVTNTKSNSLSKGHLVSGELDANNNPVGNNGLYRKEVWHSASSFAELANLTGGDSLSLTDNFTAATESSETDSESDYSTNSSGNGNNYFFYNLDQVRVNGTLSTDNQGGDGSNDSGDASPISFGRHDLSVSYVSNAQLTSQGQSAADFARDQISKITNHSIEDDSDAGGGSNDGGSGGGGGSGGDGQPDPPPTYDIDLDENTTLSNSGMTTANSNSSYGLTVNNPSFSMTFEETLTGLGGMDDGVVEKHQEMNISSVSGSQTISTTNNLETEMDWREDGGYLITNGYTETTLGASSVVTNNDTIYEYTDHDYGNDLTKLVENSIEPGDYRVTYNNATTLRDDFDGFGQKVTMSVQEDSGDTVQALGAGLLVTGQGEGVHSQTITQAGNEELILKPTKTESKGSSFGGGVRTEHVDLVKTGDWNLTDEIKGDFEEGGSYKVTYTPGGYRNSTSTLITNGVHQYTYNQVDDDHYHLHSDQNGEYDSTTTINSSLLRSGALESNYASDGVLVAASGSIVETRTIGGTAQANEDAEVNKTKSRTVQTDGDSGGDAGDTDGNGTGPDRTHYDEVYTAHKHLDFTSKDNFFATIVAEYEAGMDADGDLSISLKNDEVDINNEVWGTKSGSLSSFIRLDETDHFEDGSFETETSHIVVPEELSLDDSYGDTVLDFVADGTKTVDYVGFFKGDDTDNAFGSAGYLGQVVDTSYDQGANTGAHFGSGGEGFGEAESEYSSLLQDQDSENENDKFNSDFGAAIRALSEAPQSFESSESDIQFMLDNFDPNKTLSELTDYELQVALISIILVLDKRLHNFFASGEPLPEIANTAPTIPWYGRIYNSLNGTITFWPKASDPYVDSGENEFDETTLVFHVPINSWTAAELAEYIVRYYNHAHSKMPGPVKDFQTFQVMEDPRRLQELTSQNMQFLGESIVTLLATYADTYDQTGLASGLFKIMAGHNLKENGGSLAIADGLINEGKTEVATGVVIGGTVISLTAAGSIIAMAKFGNAPNSVGRYVYDGAASRYRDTVTGRFVAARDLPWPANAGFASSTTGTVKAGTILDRFGSPTGRFLGQPGATISQRGMAAGSEAMQYTRYRVLKPFEAKYGPAAAVPEFGASGGAMQFRHLKGKSIQWLIDNGFLEIIK